MASRQRVKARGTNLRVFGRNGPRVSVWKFPKGKYSRERIKRHVRIAKEQLLRKQRRGLAYKISVSIKYPEGWRSSKFNYVSRPVRIYSYRDTHGDSGIDADDPEFYSKFQIYALPVKVPVAGGESETNDCLFDCLKEAVPRKTKVLFDNDPAKFKSKFDLKRNDAFPLSKIPMLEECLESYKININGDYIYQSTRNCANEINLLIYDSHFTVNSAKNHKVKGISDKERIPMIYIAHPTDPSKYLVNKGGNDYEIGRDRFKEIRSKPKSSKYVLVKGEDDMTLGEFRSEFIRNADMLKKETNGLINMYKTGNIIKTSEKLFFDFNKTLNADPISNDEAEWIHEATCGALIWRDEYEGEAHKYDVVSQYPSLLSASAFQFPIKKGIYKKYTQEEFDSLSRLEYGIYKVKIHGANPKLFRVNHSNTYTHFDVATARNHGLKIEISKDEEFNALLYPGPTKVNGRTIFKEFVDTLYKLKEMKIPYAKRILNCIWGLLSQKNIMKKKLGIDSEFTFFGDTIVHKIHPVDKKSLMVHYFRNNNFFEMNYARLAPFILAAGRKMMSSMIEPHLEHIKRVHTDGFISVKKLDFPTQKSRALGSFKEGSDMGDLRYEGYCEKVELKLDSMSVMGEFII